MIQLSQNSCGCLFQHCACQKHTLNNDLVVQTDPGPMPTLMMSAPAKTSASTMSPVTTFPAYHEEHIKIGT